MSVGIHLLILTVCLVSLSCGQLPKVCTDVYDAANKTCCPSNCNYPRGTCTDISEVDPWVTRCSNSSNIVNRCNDTGCVFDDQIYCRHLGFLRNRGDGVRDFRYNWPAHVFESICVCNGNFDGYDCSRCKRGYTGSACTERIAPAVRKNFLSLTSTEQEYVITAFNRSKYYMPGYTTPTVYEPASQYNFTEISLYDVFTAFHYHSNDEGINAGGGNATFNDRRAFENVATVSADNCCMFAVPNPGELPENDFAHEGPAFLPWHRAYLNRLETELQLMLDDPSFGLPYWDWSSENHRQIWNDATFGAMAENCTHDTKPKNITGTFGEWTPVCTNFLEIAQISDLCIPGVNDQSETSQSRILRCLDNVNGSIQCLAKGEPPAKRDVCMILSKDKFDICPYTRCGVLDSFRNALEGYFVLPGSTPLPGCAGSSETHNRVHLYIGGLMQNVPTSSNDPIFWMHHCNIDRIYEAWFQSTTDTSYYPNEFSYGIKPGHNKDDNLGLIFPPITAGEAHIISIRLGYTYDELITCPSGGGGGGSSIVHSGINMLLTAVGLVVVVGFNF